MNNIQIRRMTKDDLDGIMEVELSSFTIPWTRKMFEDELTNELTVYFVACDGDKIAGYAGMWDVAGEGDITNIGVMPAYRQRGIGSALLRALFDEAHRRKLELLTLEVRNSNLVAQHMYKVHGFVNMGVRKNYYADNREDAVIMTAKLGKETC